MDDLNLDEVDEKRIMERLSNTPIFANLSQEQYHILLKLSEKVYLKSGSILFNQGDSSDGLYIVIYGHLIAYIPKEKSVKMVGVIKEGETVGELGVFSNRPRTLSVKASQYSLLLKISRSAFIEFWKNFAGVDVQLQITDSIITRSQSVIKLLSTDKLCRHIAIIPATETPIPAHFIEQLKANIQDKHQLMVIEANPLTENKQCIIQDALDQAENQNKTIIFILSDVAILEYYFNILASKEGTIILENIDAIFCIASGHQEPHLNQFASRLLGEMNLPFVSRKELVLLHGKLNALLPEKTSSWLSLSSFTLHHQIRMSYQKDYQRLIRFIIGKPVALVLSGGGAKGWAALGTLKALSEANIDIDAIAGTSAGSLVAAAYALYQDFNIVHQKLLPLTKLGQKSVSFLNLSYPLVSITNGKEFTETIYQIFDNLYAEDLWLPFFSMACNLNTGKEVRDATGLLKDNLRCSCSLPLVFPPMVKNGQLYVDGGLLNNLPVDQMRSLIGKQSYIIAVNQSETAVDHHIYNFPAIVSFKMGILRRIGLKYREWVYPPLLETFLKSLLVGSVAKTAANSKAANLLIEPPMNHLPFLNLKQDKIKQVIDIGYETTKSALGNADITPL
ncbi:patatin-like phospholipase [Legionella birminghamensis]|uniref:Patatin-like phospholipase n=1 Tax=Legionella birminghamensis TaxID=28083 RepID=A0A378I900_9GAMM|nr:patatin-like phospholipase family protein [Legionella birminghamensis]KTC67969.1 patatin-like phospholipase [Legionella birminghamensis]STX31322.1 patatin-like phospholipase [Legionella birminghamensis]